MAGEANGRRESAGRHWVSACAQERRRMGGFHSGFLRRRDEGGKGGEGGTMDRREDGRGVAQCTRQVKGKR